VRRLVTALLGWFAGHARDLPWRRTLDPYGVWVAEIMLQQTQVKTVIPYYQRWMEELPDVASLARVKQDKVLKLWEGLGYYARARNLQTAARLIVSRHGGTFPSTFNDILALPGVGRYTAGAVASIAFNHPAPILDGNVIRVLTRLFGIRQNPREPITNAKLWSLAEALVFQARHRTQSQVSTARFRIAGCCSALNQSLMELGALICTPKRPNCGQCPLRRDCVARRVGQAEAFPFLAPHPPAIARRFVAFVVEREGKWLVRRRPPGVVNACLWEFPNAEVYNPTEDLAAISRVALGVIPKDLQSLATVKHSITRSRISLQGFQGRWPARNEKIESGRWLPLSTLGKLAFASAHRKVLEALLERVRRKPQSCPRSARSRNPEGCQRVAGDPARRADPRKPGRLRAVWRP
jgi:A/G-specific adenine glycosylase